MPKIKSSPPDDPAKFQKAVHLADIHLEKGMHCIDCHFEQDSHGTGKLYAEPRAAIELDCTDCHGTIEKARLADFFRPRVTRRRNSLRFAAYSLGMAVALNIATANSSSAQWSSRTKNGKWCRCWTPSHPEIFTTAKNLAGPRRSAPTERHGATFQQIHRNSHTPIAA